MDSSFRVSEKWNTISLLEDTTIDCLGQRARLSFAQPLDILSQRTPRLNQQLNMGSVEERCDRNANSCTGGLMTCYLPL